MLKHYPGLYSLKTFLALVLVFVLLWEISFHVRPAQAGYGPFMEIPQSDIVPVMDGVCGPSEYGDAIQVSVTLDPTHTFPVYMKHTANDAYFCFGDAAGLPLPAGGESQVAIYIDGDNDGYGNESDDFGIWMPYLDGGSPWAASWGGASYNGADPGGWQAVKHQILGGSPLWQVEFRISRQTIGGWKHTVGMALFYHWWLGNWDSYSWPENGIWASPQWWGNAHFITGSVDIGLRDTIPVMDGQCSSEYSDAAAVQLNDPSGMVSAYLKHSATDLYVCLHQLTTPLPGQRDAPNAALYIDRTGVGGGAPGANDLAFSISYSGIVRANSGDGTGFLGPDPGGYSIARYQYSGGWDAEFRISSATIGNWWARAIGLVVAEQGVNSPSDYYGWPKGHSRLIPNSWGNANLLVLGSNIRMPLIFR